MWCGGVRLLEGEGARPSRLLRRPAGPASLSFLELASIAPAGQRPRRLPGKHRSIIVLPVQGLPGAAGGGGDGGAESDADQIIFAHQMPSSGRPMARAMRRCSRVGSTYHMSSSTLERNGLDGHGWFSLRRGQGTAAPLTGRGRMHV